MIKLNNLQHHGIKGQKWGVRRFQNKDGSLTNAGKKRYNDNSDYTYGKDHGTKQIKVTRSSNISNVSKSEAKKPKASDYESASKKAKNIGDIVDTAKKIKKDSETKSYEKELRSKLSQMSDKDLQQAVNRLNMEERYTQVMKQRKQLEAGKDKVDAFLEAAGSAAAGAATALAIMASITQLLDKKQK